jgi:DNA-binding MarR family transcriptional regulator
MIHIVLNMRLNPIIHESIANPMSTQAVGSLTDQILDEIETGLAHQRHKWAAQCQAHGLSMTHFHILAILQGDGPTPMSRLADQLGVALPNLTGVITRMEERGVVERIHDADDRRVVLARITPAGREIVQRVEGARLDHMRELVSALTSDEQATVLHALQTLTAAHRRVHVAQGHGHPSDSTDHKEHLPS